MGLRNLDKIKIEVAGRPIYIDPEKVPTGKFVEMMLLHNLGMTERSGQVMMEMLLSSVGREQLDKFSLIHYPFILQAWMDALIKNGMGSLEIGSEIDEIVRRMDDKDGSD